MYVPIVRKLEEKKRELNGKLAFFVLACPENRGKPGVCVCVCASLENFSKRHS